MDGSVHQQNKRMYYAENRSKLAFPGFLQKPFRSHFLTCYLGLADIIEESRTKPPCKQFMRNQFCEYGPNCKYSHVVFDRFTGMNYTHDLSHTTAHIDHHCGPPLGQPILPTQTVAASKPQPSERYELPKGWKAREMTPSLKPPPRKGYDWTQIGHWG
jgi:U11/U12 small nuclear ribonucleoprotein 20 kDa protein